eukprot:5064165-Pleurochrysis_carterae.AAC.3
MFGKPPRRYTHIANVSHMHIPCVRAEDTDMIVGEVGEREEVLAGDERFRTRTRYIQFVSRHNSLHDIVDARYGYAYSQKPRPPMPPRT